jgi:hypothetical protein
LLDSCSQPRSHPVSAADRADGVNSLDLNTRASFIFTDEYASPFAATTACIRSDMESNMKVLNIKYHSILSIAATLI